MENAQRELLSVLLGHLFSCGLISKNTYSESMDVVHALIDVPELFRYPVRLTGEASAYEYTRNTE
ncbi:hypothetical protein SAMN05216343_102113 [Oscillibacter sp. PC13]|nr:hypothetical protein SAMN05216343_102113 [Oscillibacter sp. PC13]